MKHRPHPLHSRRAVLTALGAGTLGLSMALCSATEPVPSAATLPFNVRDFGARGDGATDETDAFLKAVARAEASGGGIVSVPTGKYIIRETITLEKVGLAGTPNSWSADKSGLPTILPKHAGTAIQLKAGASLKSLDVS